jgi:hypothetical protein
MDMVIALSLGYCKCSDLAPEKGYLGVGGYGGYGGY